MKKYHKHLLFNFIILISTLWIWVGDILLFRPFCPFHKLTGIPCPGCGGFRATKAFLQGDFLQSLYINPLSIIFCFSVLLFLILGWIDFFKQTNLTDSLLKKMSKPAPTAIILVIIFANWIWGIFKGL